MYFVPGGGVLLCSSTKPPLVRVRVWCAVLHAPPPVCKLKPCQKGRQQQCLMFTSGRLADRIFQRTPVCANPAERIAVVLDVRHALPVCLSRCAPLLSCPSGAWTWTTSSSRRSCWSASSTTLSSSLCPPTPFENSWECCRERGTGDGGTGAQREREKWI